jgi:heptosyltransferase-2
VSRSVAPIPVGEIRRALVRCPNWLGDTVMALPTIHALRDALPRAELWGLGPWVPAVLATEPALNRLLPYPRRWADRWALTRELRQADLDLALLLPNSFESALGAWLAGARRRVGYSGDGRAALLTHPVPPSAERCHQVAEYLALLRPLGLAPRMTAPTLAVAPTHRDEARRLLREVGVRSRDRPVAIQLGAAFGPSKLWPAERLAALASRLEADGTPVVFLGSPEAAALLAAVEHAMAAPPRTLVGRDHVALLPALLAEFAVLVTPDSGPAHLGAAVGVPVVALFGPTDPRRSAPLGSRHLALWRPPPCAPCYQPHCPIDHRCVRAITVDEVRRAVHERLQVDPRAPA